MPLMPYQEAPLSPPPPSSGCGGVGGVGVLEVQLFLVALA